MIDKAVFELAPKDFHKARKIYERIEIDRASIESVLEGQRPGRVFVDSPDLPTSALLCHHYGNYYPAGVVDTTLLRMLIDMPIEIGIFSGPFFAFFSADKAWLSALSSEARMVRGAIDRRRFKLVAIHDIADSPLINSEPYCLRLIDEPLAKQIDREMNMYIGHCWDGYDRFISQGFGYCVCIGSRIASVSWSFAVSATTASIDVETCGEYWRQGLATKTCSAAIRHCRTKNLVAEWVCDRSNIASVALAMRLGFIEQPSHWQITWKDYGQSVKHTTGLWKTEGDLDKSFTTTRVWRPTGARHL